ncbi:MAG: AAA family ATPase [Candidatus Thorarchaeota archaeon]|jgi:O-phosphoseryl-tRNA(Sec) kinase
MTQFILALCGLPASGKTALAEAIQKALKFDVVIVSTDEWRDDSYYKDWTPEKEGPVRQAALDRVEKLIADRKSVIHDDTNYYNSMRHDLFKIALDNGCGFTVIHVTTPVDVALKWNSERPSTRIPDSVIERINDRFDLPGRRYLWDDSMMEVNMSSHEIDAAVAEIVEGIQGLGIVTEPEPRLVTNTEFEKLDVETRRTVSKFLEEHPDLRGNREISETRRSVLRHATQRKIPVGSVYELLLERLNRLL